MGLHLHQKHNLKNMMIHNGVLILQMHLTLCIPSWAPNLVANWPCHCGLEDLSVKRICLFLSTLRLLRCLMQDD